MLFEVNNFLLKSFITKILAKNNFEKFKKKVKLKGFTIY